MDTRILRRLCVRRRWRGRGCLPSLEVLMEDICDQKRRSGKCALDYGLYRSGQLSWYLIGLRLVRFVRIYDIKIRANFSPWTVHIVACRSFLFS
jgi:hypothetical protein